MLLQIVLKSLCIRCMCYVNIKPWVWCVFRCNLYVRLLSEQCVLLFYFYAASGNMVMFYSIQGTMKSAPFKLKHPFLMSLMIFQTALFLSESFLILKCTRNLSKKASVCAFSQKTHYILSLSASRYCLRLKSFLSVPQELSGLRFFSRTAAWRDKKDAEASKIVTSPYKRTAEAIFGGRKSG